jgi:hypothetical protein
MRIASEILTQWRATADSVPLSDHLIPRRDYAGLCQQEEQLRIWLPDQARQALSEVCRRTGINITTYLTEFFVTYLYGIHEVMRMRDLQQGIYESSGGQVGLTDAPDDYQTDLDEIDAEFDDPAPEMGKNIFSLKIFLSGKIKAGLQRRAERAGVSLGRFVRAMICAHLFGRDISPQRLVDG